jgi:hypothetical protein
MADYSWPNVSMPEGCGELPLHPAVGSGDFLFWVADVRVGCRRLKLRPAGNNDRDSLRGGGPCLKRGKQS